MKLKEIFFLLGIRPGVKTYEYSVEEHLVEGFAPFKYAHWLHPKERRRAFHANQINELKKFVLPGDFCIDIGAHTGDTTIPMALAVGKNGLVLAIEPNRYVYPVLNTTTLLNSHCLPIVPLMAAAGTNYGEMTFEYSDSGYCNGGKHENISKWKHGHAFPLKVVSVDIADYLHSRFADYLPKLKFIKVDTEGYDLFILEALAEILEKHRPYIKAEVYKKTDSLYRSKMFNLLTKMGYRIYHGDRDEHLEGESILSIEDMGKWKHFDIFAVPPDIR